MCVYIFFFFFYEHWYTAESAAAALYISRRLPPPRARERERERDYQRTVHALTSSTLVGPRASRTRFLAGAAAATDRACARAPVVSSVRSDRGRRRKTSNCSPVCCIIVVVPFRSNRPPAVTPPARLSVAVARPRRRSFVVVRRQCARNPRAMMPRARFSFSVLSRGRGGGP